MKPDFRINPTLKEGFDVPSNIEERHKITNQFKNVLMIAHQYASSCLGQAIGSSIEITSNLDKLCQTYLNEKICLFTGAGVSFTESKYYQTPGWWDLLLESYGQIQPELIQDEQASRFNQLRKSYFHPWQMASYLERKAGAERFTEILCQLLYSRTTKKGQKLRPIGKDEDKRLPISYLNHAATLNAIIAFCSSIRAIRTHPCLQKNNKIQAVLTLNYDCFLEAGATKKYNSGRFKPRAANAPPEKEHHLPVYHIHGYIPYGGRTPATELVLTEKSYQEAYQQKGIARTVIDEFLSQFSTLFIGISFNDELLLQRLENLAKQDGSRNHFAILKQGISDNLLNRLQSAKVNTIFCKRYEEIPLTLGHVYKTVLPKNPMVAIESRVNRKITKVRRIKLSQDEYWELLLFNKR